MDLPFIGLSVYVPTQKSDVAHLVRHFQDTGEVYIFCNRYLGKPGGAIYSVEEFAALKYNDKPFCSKCQAAIEAAMERVGVLQGHHPAQLKEAVKKRNMG